VGGVDIVDSWVGNMDIVNSNWAGGVNIIDNSWVGGVDIVNIIVDSVGLPKSKYIDFIGPI